MVSENTLNSATTPGAESIEMQEGNSRGILLLHGFGDTPQTLQLLARELHASGHDVVAPLLPGHGRNVESFTRSRGSDWIALARSELLRMKATHERVALGGLSMGGALAAVLAAETPGLSALVLMAPYLGMPARLRFLAASHWLWGPVTGTRQSMSPGSILDPVERAKNLGYGVSSGRLLYELWRTAARGRRALRKITVPTLVLQSRNDPRVSPSVAEDAFAAVATAEKKLVWIEGAGHIITVDYGREKLFQEVKSWLAAHP
jgi:carboxylesterase